MTEDDTFDRLLRPSFKEMKEIVKTNNGKTIQAKLKENRWATTEFIRELQKENGPRRYVS